MTNDNNIEFNINTEEKLVLEMPISLGKADCCCDAEIYYCNKNHTRVLIASDSIQYNLEILCYLLTKALNTELFLDDSISEDIGLLHNLEAYGNAKNLKYKKNFDGDQIWVGEQYDLWGAIFDENSFLSSWIYNDKNGNIIFELTPFYRKHRFINNEKPKNIVPYDEWIKNYKPILIRVIPKNVAQQWLNQAQEILKKIEENTARLHA